MNIFTGTYSCKIDVKGRFTVPSDLKKDLAEVMSEGFIMKPSVFDPCLEIYPRGDWEQRVAIMNKKLNPYNRKEARLLRKLSTGGRRIELDASGRILIPKELMVKADVEKEIVLTAVAGKIELWSKANYDEFMEEDDIADLAEELLGGKNIFDELS